MLNPLTRTMALCAALAALQTGWAQGSGVASRLLLRGEAEGIAVPEMRTQRRGDVLVVQADIQNTVTKDRQVYYRFRWLDAGGQQVGDGEPWKPLSVYGKQLQTIKGVAPTSGTTDFRLEMNVETP